MLGSILLWALALQLWAGVQKQGYQADEGDFCFSCMYALVGLCSLLSLWLWLKAVDSPRTSPASPAAWILVVTLGSLAHY